MRVYVSAVIELCLDDCLCLGSVDCVTIEVGSSDEPPLPLSPPVSTSHQSNIVGRGSHMGESDVDKS